MRRIYEFVTDQAIIRVEETPIPNSLILCILDEHGREIEAVIPRITWSQMHEITDGYRAYQTFTYTEAPTTETSNPTTPTDPDQS